MSDTPGDALPKIPPPPPPIEPPADDDDAVNLIDGSVEPTDDSPTVISKTPQSQAVVRAEDNPSGGLRGRRLAHFELIEPIGVGGMAAVLRARDTQLDRTVALKILPPEMAADPENVRRFHQEARSAARLDHENIARVFFCGEDQRLHFIAFEFVEGDNLRTILEKRGRVPVGEALHYMLQVAAGLAHAARRGVVHRDIKPSNIIITPNGRAKLVDMGLARSMEPQHDQGLTQSGVTLGTFDYISPEQALEPRDADVRSDIYSLGCTFYHMLTGQPPVPEGTGLKKLHHHQHVKPPDPRQFVPDLPDEVAIILDRMMAKQPKDRYQTPEHLVHHLYLAARKLGAAGEVPEGVLAVEAALPNPPGGRPLVLAAVAAIAVVALIFLVDASSTPKPQLPPDLPVEFSAAKSGPEPSDRETTARDRPKKTENTTPIESVKTPNKIPTFDVEKPTPTQLAEFCQTNKFAPKIILKLDDLVFRDGDPDVVITNPIVEIQPRKSGQRPTIYDAYRPHLPDTFEPRTFQASLIITSETCTIENIRFVLDQNGAQMPMAIVWLLQTRNANIRGCEFIQVNPSFNEEKRMASVLAESERPATLTVTESCFLGFLSLYTPPSELPQDLTFNGAGSGGQDTITRRGPVRIEPTNCLFGPHRATFRLENTAGESSLVRINHCSVLVGNQSAVYDLTDGADAQIEASYSLFSYPGDDGMMGIGMVEVNGAVLMRRASSQGNVAYHGVENRYHHLDYLAIADAPKETVQLLRDAMNIRSSEKLDRFPWMDPQPLGYLKEELRPSAVQAAFAVDPTLPELRVRSQERGRDQLIGAEGALAFSYPNNLPSLENAPEAPAVPERVVRTGAEVDKERLIFPTLDYALVEAKSGDIIRLQVDGEVKFNPRVLNGEKSADLTLRADPGFHPILVLNAEEQRDLSALLEIRNGKLQLEGLEIRFQPHRDSKCALISFYGDGKCVFKNCVVTLEHSNRKAVLAVLPEKRLRRAFPSMGAPRLVVENCFIRGQGDLLGMQSGHAAEVTIDNSLIALSGSLVNIDNDPKDRKEDEPISTATLTLHLTRVTTYLGEHLIRLHAAKEIQGLPRTHCKAGDCLFLPCWRDRALVRLEGPEAEERGLREKLFWESLGKNAYGDFTTMLEQKPSDIMMAMPKSSGQGTWATDMRENDSKYKVKLDAPPAADAPFTKLLPKKFQPADDLKGFGADLVALNSLPALENKKEEPDFDFDFPDFDAELDSDQ